jgi:gliding motility-associated lipoprotein GldH
MSRLIVITLAVLIIVGCKDNVIYKQENKITGDWLYNDTLSYTWIIEDTSKVSELLLDVSFDQDSFNYENLYVQISTIYPDQKINKQIVSLDIQDTESYDVRNCSGARCTVPILLLNNFKFTSKGNHTLKIAQYGRENKLAGIKAIQLLITQYKD